MPIEGTIKEIKYIPGKFINATLDKSSEQNEKNIIKISNGTYNYFVVQIAGLIARRIVCNVNKNQDLKKGDRIGIIKFGSRVDLYLPKSNKILVSKIEKEISEENSPDDRAEWGLRNQNGIPVASGMYIAYIIVEDENGNNLGERIIKLAVFQPEERLSVF